MAPDGNAVIATIRPDVDEAARVLFGVTMRAPGVRLYLIVAAVLGVILILVSGSFMADDPVIGYGSIVIGLILIVGPIWSIRSAIRKRLRDRLPSVIGNTFTFADSGIDSKSKHASGHYDWPAVPSGRRIPEGLLFQAGQVTVFMSVRYFESEADFERTLDLFRHALGAKFIET